jgi:hypothetical protein
VLDVVIETIEETPQRVQLTAIVLWSRRHSGKDTEFKERLRLDCPVPSLRKTPKATRPTILLAVAPPSAA